MPTASGALSVPAANSAAHGLDLSDLVAWSVRPDVEAELDALEGLAHRRVRLLAARHAPEAVRTLATLLADAAHPEVARKAASALLRLLGKGPTPAAVTEAVADTPTSSVVEGGTWPARVAPTSPAAPAPAAPLTRASGAAHVPPAPTDATVGKEHAAPDIRPGSASTPPRRPEPALARAG